VSRGKVFHVTDAEAGKTLAAALRGWLDGQSWRSVKRTVTTRHVMIDGNLCIDPERRLSAGEVVKLMPHPLAPPPREKDVRVVFFDQHVIVVDKPAGVTTTRHHEERQWSPRRKQQQPTLDEMLPRIMAKIEGGRRSNKRSGGSNAQQPVRAVHRIDRETSGLLVFARTGAAARELIRQFREHATQRKYWAIAIGKVDKRRIESHLVRDRGDGRRGSATTSDVGKRAVTHVKPIETIGDAYTLLECQLETGRTHQIRIHLAEIGHPLCGEKVYNRPLRGKRQKDPSGAPRIALHAAELGFTHPTDGKPMHFESPLPDDLQTLLKRLRGKG